jgi:hypothetical protein
MDHKVVCKRRKTIKVLRNLLQIWASRAISAPALINTTATKTVWRWQQVSKCISHRYKSECNSRCNSRWNTAQRSHHRKITAARALPWIKVTKTYKMPNWKTRRTIRQKCRRRDVSVVAKVLTVATHHRAKDKSRQTKWRRIRRESWTYNN